MLKIDVGTSKSQYCRTKSLIRNKLEKIRKLKSCYSENSLCG